MPCPEFMVAGERRAGTTTLHHWLSCSPRVAVTGATDSMYFLEEQLRGVVDTVEPADAAAWDAAHDPGGYAGRFADMPADRARGEKCADVLFWSSSHERIRRFVPGIRLVLTLRDPVTRAWSHYWNEVGKGRETADFDTALRRDLDDAYTSDWQRFHLSYARRGFYDESLTRLFDTFPRENVLSLVLEESRADPQAAMDQVHAFLGVEPAAVELTARPVNRNWTSTRRGWVDRLGCAPVERAYEGVVRRVTSRALRGAQNRWSRTREVTAAAMWPFRRRASAEVMDAATERRLRDLYAPHTAALCELLGRPAPPWGRT